MLRLRRMTLAAPARPGCPVTFLQEPVCEVGSSLHPLEFFLPSNLNPAGCSFACRCGFARRTHKSLPSEVLLPRDPQRSVRSSLLPAGTLVALLTLHGPGADSVGESERGRGLCDSCRTACIPSTFVQNAEGWAPGPGELTADWGKLPTLSRPPEARSGGGGRPGLELPSTAPGAAEAVATPSLAGAEGCQGQGLVLSLTRQLPAARPPPSRYSVNSRRASGRSLLRTPSAGGRGAGSPCALTAPATALAVRAFGCEGDMCDKRARWSRKGGPKHQKTCDAAEGQGAW